jgi:hypothetical protein
MLQKIDPLYKEEAQQIFQIVSAFKVEAPNRNLQLTVLDLALAMEDETPLIEGLPTFVQHMGRRLQSRCAGLLEIQESRIGRPEGGLVNTVKESGAVQYLHRTVRDFLMRKEVRNNLYAYSTSSSFDPTSSLSKSSVLKLNLFGGVVWSDPYIWEVMEAAIAFAKASKTGNTGQWLDRMDETVFKHMKEVLNTSRVITQSPQTRVMMNMGLPYWTFVPSGEGMYEFGRNGDQEDPAPLEIVNRRKHNFDPGEL